MASYPLFNLTLWNGYRHGLLYDLRQSDEATPDSSCRGEKRGDSRLAVHCDYHCNSASYRLLPHLPCGYPINSPVDILVDRPVPSRRGMLATGSVVANKNATAGGRGT